MKILYLDKYIIKTTQILSIINIQLKLSKQKIDLMRLTFSMHLYILKKKKKGRKKRGGHRLHKFVNQLQENKAKKKLIIILILTFTPSQTRKYI